MRGRPIKRTLRGRLSSTGPRRERVLPVQVDSRRSTSKSDSRSASCRISACVQRAQSNDRAWLTRVVRDRSVTNLRVGALGASVDLRNNAPGPARDRPAARRRPPGGGLRPPPAGVSAGSEVSRGHLFKNRVVEGLVRHQLLEPRVFPLELLEPLGLIDPQAPVLLPPPIIRLLAESRVSYRPGACADRGSAPPRPAAAC